MKSQIQHNEYPKLVPEATVLLVEDEEEVRKWGNTALSKLGFTVLQARDGLEAVNIFKKHKNEISCLFCDLSMPHMDGWETITALRAIRQNLPVILTSGYEEESVMEGKHSELPDFFLDKPYGVNKLGHMIENAIALKTVA
ncbi:MAG: response regulator [Victivallales bacterium]